MKRFMYMSIGVLCLSLSALIGFHVGSGSVQAQAPEAIAGYRVVPGSANGQNAFHYVMLSNGDVYGRRWDANNVNTFDQLQYAGNFWNGAVSSEQSSWGNIKGKYDGNK